MSDKNPECECATCALARIVGRDLAEMMVTQRLVAAVREYGWASMAILEDEETRGFVYTVGFNAKGKPDLCVIGLHPNMASFVFRSLFEREGDLTSGEYSVGANFKVKLAEMPEREVRETMKSSRQYDEEYNEGNTFRALKVFWPDLGGRFPCDPDFDVGEDGQLNQDLYK